MKIAILGTRGIPNNYGGFEQFAEYLSVGLVKKGFEVFVYSPHNHKYREKEWNGVQLIHCFDPEYKVGTAGQFIYDLNCIRDSRQRSFDIILQLGYTSSSVWSFLFPKGSVVLTNMDGLEWKRTKYGKSTQKFLKYAERLAVKHSRYLVSDSVGIQKYIRQEYGVESEYIPYGAFVFNDPEQSVLNAYGLEPYQYDLVIARLEPENSIETILEGYSLTKTNRKCIVIGNHNTPYGEYLKGKFGAVTKIVFLGSLYDMRIVNNLRYFSNLYFHGHTVGGTNPSLLEAMACSTLIVANKNDFNSFILGSDAYYFSNATEIESLVNSVHKCENEKGKLLANLEKIKSFYSWENITNLYEKLFLKYRKT